MCGDGKEMKLIKLKDYNSIYSVEDFMPEYKSLFGKSMEECRSCLKKLAVNLKILDQEGLKKALTYQQFEKLENEDLYSIRYVGQLNPRVVFAHVEKGKVILLASFKEKNKSDYSRAINKAKQRLKSLEVMSVDSQ